MYSRLYLNHGYSYIFTSCRTLIPYRNSNRRYYYEPNLRRNLKYRCRTGGCHRSQIRCCPISRRIDQRRPSIRIMADQFPDMLLGAGNVLTTEQADRAIAAGAKFMSVPALIPKLFPTVSKKIFRSHPESQVQVIWNRQSKWA